MLVAVRYGPHVVIYRYRQHSYEYLKQNDRYSQYVYQSISNMFYIFSPYPHLTLENITTPLEKLYWLPVCFHIVDKIQAAPSLQPQLLDSALQEIGPLVQLPPNAGSLSFYIHASTSLPLKTQQKKNLSSFCTHLHSVILYCVLYSSVSVIFHSLVYACIILFWYIHAKPFGSRSCW